VVLTLQLVVVSEHTGWVGEPNRRGDTSARPQPRKNYWAAAQHERRILSHHHLPLYASKSALTLFSPASASASPIGTLRPLPDGVAGRRLLRCARRRGLPLGASLARVHPRFVKTMRNFRFNRINRCCSAGGEGGGDGDGTGHVPRGVRPRAARHARLQGAPLRRGNRPPRSLPYHCNVCAAWVCASVSRVEPRV
jgi:hypothetical protein